MKGIVAKFGGTSVADVNSIGKCVDIILKTPQIKIVVVSATANTTNHLESVASHCCAGNLEKAQEVINQISDRHLNIAKELKVQASTLQTIEKILTEAKELAQGIFLLRECSKKTMDQLYSIGERISSQIFTVALKAALKSGQSAALKDAREVIKTDENFGSAMPSPMEIKSSLFRHWFREIDGDHEIIVTQGFIGSTKEGHTTTLGREGSDFSATLLGEALDAECIQIWKDVSGIATTDPREIPNARYIPELSYSEMEELATLGAKVLHPFTLRPAVRSDIPVFLGNTFDSHTPGTWIKETSKHRPLVQALAVRENQTLVTFTSVRRVEAYQFYAEVFNILAKHKVKLDLVNTHETHLTFLMKPRQELNEEVRRELSGQCEIYEEENLAMVSLVGHGMSETKGFMTRLFAFLDSFKIRQLSFGSGKHGLSLLVAQQRAKALLKLLHFYFIEEVDLQEYRELDG